MDLVYYIMELFYRPLLAFHQQIVGKQSLSVHVGLHVALVDIQPVPVIDPLPSSVIGRPPLAADVVRVIAQVVDS